jgi:hypothetical protein
LLAKGIEHCPLDVPLQKCVRDLAAASHPAPTIETWLSAGEGMTEAQAVAIAFNDATLDGYP